MATNQLRGALYLRVSTKIQDETTQEPDLRKQAKLDGVEVTNIFRDQESGLKNEHERDGLKQLLTLQKSDIDIIYVWEISRLSRNPTHFERLIAEFREKGINICFVKPQLLYLFDIHTGEEKISDSIALSIFSKFALHEITQKNARIRRGKREAILSKNNSYTGKPPYGYMTVNKKLLLNKKPISEFIGFRTEEEVVRSIFELYAQGTTLSKIKTILNDYNLPTRSHDFLKKPTLMLNNQIDKPKSEIKWGRRSIHNILNNTVYYGEKEIFSKEEMFNDGVKVKKRIKMGAIQVDPIITKTLFDQVHQQTQNNIAIANKAYKNEFLLRGIIKCGSCGKHFLGSGSKGRNYYHCADRTHRRQNTFLNCRNCSISTNIDQVIWDLTKSTYEGEKQKQSIKENLSKYLLEKGDIERQIKLKENLLSQNELKISNLAKRLSLVSDSMVAHILKESEEIEKHSMAINQDIKDLSIRLSILDSQIHAINNDQVNSKFIENINNNYQLKKEAVKEILVEVVVYKIDNVYRVIKIMFKNGYMVNVIYNWKLKSYVEAPEALFKFDNEDLTFKYTAYKIDGFSLESIQNAIFQPHDLFEEMKINGSYYYK